MNCGHKTLKKLKTTIMIIIIDAIVGANYLFAKK